MRVLTLTSLLATIALTLPTVSQAAVDEAGAEALMKSSGCGACHAVDTKKMGPAFKDVAAKYKGQADAADKLYKHVTTGPMVKIGTKEQKHAIVKSTDEAAIKNLVAYILSR
jgi:cytochrome c